MMKKYVLIAFMLLCIKPLTAQEWMGGLTVGVALPAGASNNAPQLSTSFTAGLRAMYLLDNSPLAFSVMIDGVHWVKSEHPDRSAVPLDDKVYAFRSLHFPATLGVNYLWGDRSKWLVDCYVAGGVYWRNLTCQRMAAPGVMDDMEEHGWGMAWKAGIDVIFLSHCGISVSYTALGNPFAAGGAPLPAGTGPVEDGVRRSQPSLEGYGQGFLNISVDYWL